MIEKNFKERFKIAGGVAVLYVGATSEVEMKEKKTELMMHYTLLVLLLKKELLLVVVLLVESKKF